MTATITLDPDPPVAGQPCKVCYTGSLPQTLTVMFKKGSTWDPPINIECTSANGGCVTVNVPSSATRMTVEDASGSAPYRDVPVV